MSGYALFLENGLENLKYLYKAKTKDDVLMVLQIYQDLKPGPGDFTFISRTEQRLLTLKGTVPITSRAIRCSIPIEIWLRDTHPFQPPMVFVCPTPDMQIIVSGSVDHSGRVYHPYLYRWTSWKSNLTGLLEALTEKFSAQLPVKFIARPYLPAMPLTYNAANFMQSDYPDNIVMVSVAQYREKMYRLNPGQQLISAFRESIESLLSNYKQPYFNFKKKPNVQFIGETGQDVGALTKEYFADTTMLLKSSKINGMHTLFEGQADHLLPASNPILLSTGYFRLLGQFIGHSALHTDIGFIGLSKAAIKYLFSEDADISNMSSSVEIDDIPNFNSREVLNKIKLLGEGIPLEYSDLLGVRSMLEEAGIYERPTFENAYVIMQTFLDWDVLHSRAAYFSAIRSGLKTTGMYDFLKEREYLWNDVFPTEASLTVDPTTVLAKIMPTGEIDANLMDVLAAFVVSLDPSQISILIKVWTGMAVLPREPLEVKFTPGKNFVFHACFNQLEIPCKMSAEDLRKHLLLAIIYAPSGFGSA